MMSGWGGMGIVSFWQVLVRQHHEDGLELEGT